MENCVHCGGEGEFVDDALEETLADYYEFDERRSSPKSSVKR